MVIFFVCSRGAPHLPEPTLAVSPVLGSVRGFLLFCLQRYNLGPLRSGMFFSALRVLHLSLL